MANAGIVFNALFTSLPQDQLEDNTNIPSGYTYLSQLVAHDLVQSTEPLWLAMAAGIPVDNARMRSLRLDTLYGGGPTVCPLAYEPGPDAAPDYATKLRLGRVSDAENLAGQCPMRDLARVLLPVPPAPETTANAGAAPPPACVAKLPPAGGPLANFDEKVVQLYLADVRNGEGAILSQLVVMFFILHNGIIDKLSALPPSAQFAYARALVLWVYRSVIRNDLLKRLLHEKVYDRLRTRPADSGEWLWHGSAIPYEFSHGAFRLGHGMTRDAYTVNERRGDLLISEVLEGVPRDGPLPSDWIVEWSRFFGTRGSLNFASKFAATQSLALNDSNVLAVVADGAPDNISLRDWLSAAAARMWRTDALINVLSQHYPGLKFVRPTQVAAWLLKLIQAQENDREKAILRSNLNELAGDLPLPLYVMLESQLDPDVQGGRAGVLGSIVIGEVLFRRLAEEDEAAKHDPLTHAARDAIGDTHWAEIDAIRNMPALIELTGKWGGLAQCRTLPFIVQPPG